MLGPLLLQYSAVLLLRYCCLVARQAGSYNCKLLMLGQSWLQERMD
jgi:hypothetical protein